MARKREFYDATKKERRDESWRRWKGGQKLADQLRVFYTSKSALDRIAWHNANAGLSAATSKPKANGDLRSAIRREAIAALIGGQKRGQQGGWPGIVSRAQAAVSAASAQSDAGLSGQTGPKR